jgi:hydroxyethylthiazole kinase-like sugar kinase family protein
MADGSGLDTILEHTNTRLNRIEDTLAKQTEQIAILTGSEKCVNDKLETICLTLEKITSSQGTNGMLQKGLLGAIVVQSLLHGITTPEIAQTLIKSIFGAQ